MDRTGRSRHSRSTRLSGVWHGVDQGRASVSIGRRNPGRVSGRRHPLLDFLSATRAGRIGIKRTEEHTSELQSLMRNSYAVFCMQKKNNKTTMKTVCIILRQIPDVRTTVIKYKI